MEQSNETFKNSPHGATTKKSNSTVLTLSIICGILAIALIAFGIMYFNTNSTASRYGNALEASYKKTFYELLDNVNDIDLNLSKVEVSNKVSLQQKYLQLVSDNCKYAQNNFSTLPVGLNTVNEGVKFINQMDGYCSSLIASDDALTDEEKSKVSELRDITLELKSSLNAIVTKLLQGYSILENSDFDEEGLSNFSSNFQGLSADSISYPSMIFDGPFSDSLYNKDIKGLEDNEISQEDATSLVGQIFADNENAEITFIGETNGNFVTYDYEIDTNDRVYFVQITKQGGFLLSLSAYGEPSETVSVDIQECELIAKSFADGLTLANMQSVWSENIQGICFINLAPVINNVIYYPDLIKVKIEMATGTIIGWEAQNYAYNHTTRDDTTPTIGATEARDLIDIVLNINNQNLCIMPLEYGGEALAYEFECEYYGSTYYVYINAHTGEEERVLKVVTTDEGNLTE